MRTVGIDFGLSVTDSVVVEDGAVVDAAALEGLAADRHGLDAALESVGGTAAVARVAVTGGRSRALAGVPLAVPVVVVDEPTAVGRGALGLARLERALAVSCGTGTAMIAADPATGFVHVTGTPVGGGTLAGLGALLLGMPDARAVADLALRGRAAAVDTTLADVLGGGLGELPPTATAVSLGRLAAGDRAPAPEDLAAGITTMVAQTIGILAVNAARAHGFEQVVLVGRMIELRAIRAMVEAVFGVYRAGTPVVPPEAARATAFGAALTAALDPIPGGASGGAPDPA